jgi:hypothetical protein
VNPRRALSELRAPDEAGAQERAWATVQVAYRDRPVAAPRRTRRRVAVVPLGAILIGALALSPAGANVGRLINHALSVPRATSEAGFSLPAAGRLLVSSPGGTWTIARGGSVRRLGSWTQASWSPHGRYVTAVSTGRLAALDSRGNTAWRLMRPGVADPRWYSPSGFRVAYLSARDLRVVAGDGSGDRLLATGVAAVAPAWRPGHPFQLAYVSAGGGIVVRDADSGQKIWAGSAPLGQALDLSWSPAGTRLLLVTSTGAWIYTPDHPRPTPLPLPAQGPVRAAAASPDGRWLALMRGGGTAGVQVADLTAPKPRFRTLLSGIDVRQLTWSPDGRWLLVTWPAADQWLFVHVAGTPRILAASRVAEHLGVRRSRAGPVHVEGWCCSAGG